MNNLLSIAQSVPRPLALPSHLCIQHSGGKDSTTMLIQVVNEYRGRCPITVFHQDLPEAWSGTVEYCQKTCDRLGVPLVVQKIYYHAYECRHCSNRYLSAKPKLKCPRCKLEGGGRQVGQIEGLLDLIEWRKKWPGQGAVRWCTAYLKRAVFDTWASDNRASLGSYVVNCMGERWAESPNRAKLPYLEPRPSKRWITQWHPTLHLRRIETFWTMREAGFEPHPCYALQNMTPQQMYELDEEGGPRCSCMMCIFLSPPNLKNNSEIPQNKAQFDRVEAIEDRTGHFFRPGLSIRRIRSGIYQPDESFTPAQPQAQIKPRLQTSSGFKKGAAVAVKGKFVTGLRQTSPEPNEQEQTKTYRQTTFLW